MAIHEDNIYIGMELPKLYKTPTTRQLVQYAGASFDYYEIHYDKDVAQQNNLPGVIVHGALKAAFFGELITKWMEPKGKLLKLLYPKEKLLIDGCHSITSAKNLVSYLKTLNKDIYGIWGIQNNRKPKDFLRNFKGVFKKIIAVKIPDEINSCKPKKLKKIANQLNFDCSTAPNIHYAIKKLSNKKEKVIVCFGSLYLVGKILSLN